MGKAKELRVSAYFSQNKAEDMELWDFLKKFDTGAKSHYLKLLARLGMDVFEKLQLGGSVEVEKTSPIKPKRGRRTITKPTSPSIVSQPKPAPIPAVESEPILEVESAVLIYDDDDIIVFEKIDDSDLVAKARANMDNV